MNYRCACRTFHFLLLLLLRCVRLFCLSGSSSVTLYLVVGKSKNCGLRTKSKWNAASHMPKDEHKVVKGTANLREIAKAITLAPNISQPCQDGWKYLLMHNQTYERDSAFFGSATLAQRAIDAFGRPGAGILEGNLYAYGSYDECMETDHTQYCMSSTSYSQHVFQPTCKLGVCVPQECSKNDVLLTAKELIAVYQRVEVIANMDVSSNVNKIHCETERYPPYTTGAIIVILVCCIVITAVLVGTLIDWLSQTVYMHKAQVIEETSEVYIGNELAHGMASKRSNKAVLDIVLSFSLIRNVSSILSAKQSSLAIPSLNGIRVISMFWIILLHTIFLVIGEADNQLYFHNHVIHHFSFLVCGNIAFPVDTFFLLSGLLASYHTLNKMAVKNGRISIVRYYLHRYLRITPTLAFILFFYWFLSMHLTDGPEYQAETGLNSPRYKNCEKYWWTHLLYINNFYLNSTSNECFKETWYLSTDMQFYLLSPLIIVLLYHNRRLGLISVVLVLFSSFVTTAVFVGYHGFDASYPGLLFLDMLQLVNQKRPVRYTSKPIYSQHFTRISPFLVGIILCYLFYTETTICYKRFIVRRAIHLAMWVLAAFLCISVIHRLCRSHPLTLVENTRYFTFSRFAWSIGIALVVFACHNGYGSVVNSFLSLKLWLPLSRLTFSTYLVHPIVIAVIRNQLRDPLHYTGTTLVVYVIAVVVLSYGSAGLVGALVEFPMSNLEAIMFKKIDQLEKQRQGKKNDREMKVNGFYRCSLIFSSLHLDKSSIS